MPSSKRMNALRDKAAKQNFFTLDEAAAGVKDCATAKFDETIELAFYLGVDPRHADQVVRGTVSLPHGTGKTARVIVFCKAQDQADAAKAAGAIEAGGDELVQKVSEGWMDFDVVVAAPDMMGAVGKLGRVLGPRGLMPSPKAGTVTPKVGEAVEDIMKGKIDYRVSKHANIHVPVGKASFTVEQIRENAAAIIDSVIKARPASTKGIYMKACCISSTMGPGFKLDPASLAGQVSN